MPTLWRAAKGENKSGDVAHAVLRRNTVAAGRVCILRLQFACGFLLALDPLAWVCLIFALSGALEEVEKSGLGDCTPP